MINSINSSYSKNQTPSFKGVYVERGLATMPIQRAIQELAKKADSYINEPQFKALCVREQNWLESIANGLSELSKRHGVDIRIGQFNDEARAGMEVSVVKKDGLLKSLFNKKAPIIDSSYGDMRFEYRPSSAVTVIPPKNDFFGVPYILEGATRAIRNLADGIKNESIKYMPKK